MSPSPHPSIQYTYTVHQGVPAALNVRTNIILLTFSTLSSGFAELFVPDPSVQFNYIICEYYPIVKMKEAFRSG